MNGSRHLRFLTAGRAAVCLLFLAAAFFSAGWAMASSPEEALTAFRQSDWKDFSQYFSSARVNGQGFLELDAKPSFDHLGYFGQYKVMRDVMLAWRDQRGPHSFESSPVVAVKGANGGSLWTLDHKYSRIAKLESWDMIRPYPASLSRTAGRFFAYFGFNMHVTPNVGSSTFNMGLNLRLGSYLYKNILDSALSFDGGATGTTDSLGNTNSSSNMDLGIMMRYHFPLVKTGALSGNVGGGLDLVTTGTTGAVSSSFTGYGLTGMSVRMGPSATFDVSAKLETHPVMMMGITTFLGH